MCCSRKVYNWQNPFFKQSLPNEYSLKVLIMELTLPVVGNPLPPTNSKSRRSGVAFIQDNDARTLSNPRISRSPISRARPYRISFWSLCWDSHYHPRYTLSNKARRIALAIGYMHKTQSRAGSGFSAWPASFGLERCCSWSCHSCEWSTQYCQIVRRRDTKEGQAITQLCHLCLSSDGIKLPVHVDLIVGGVKRLFDVVGKTRFWSIYTSTEGLEAALPNVESKLVEATVKRGVHTGTEGVAELQSPLLNSD